MSHGIKVGDRVRLVGKSWEEYNDQGLGVGSLVTVDEISENGFIWAGVAGSVGDERGLYTQETSEGGNYTAELVEPGSVYPRPPVTFEDILRVRSLGEVLGVQTFEENTRRILSEIGDMLVEKNKAYGNAALNPVNVFSKADRTEQIRVRIDDKLNRIRNGHEFPGDDTLRDLVGYLTLLIMARESE